MSELKVIGVDAPRIEDGPLLTGRGTYIADVRLPRMVEACFVRSQLAHARILAVDTSVARACEWVRAAVSAEDLVDVDPVPHFYPIAKSVGMFPLARERVRYVGAPLAVVVADDRYAAEDAAELIEPRLEPLPTVAGIDAALALDAPLLYPEWPDNRLVDVSGANPDADDAFTRLRTIGGTYVIKRHGPVPMETRGVVAEFDGRRLTVWSGTQFPHILRTLLSYVLRLREGSIRVIAPDIGGGFGGKAEVYPEEYVIPWLALRLGRPVRWIEDRYEHLVAACHARDVRMDVEAAVHEDGRIEAVRGRILQDLGSGEIYPAGFNPSFVATGLMTGPYRIPHQKFAVTCVVTNKTPAGAYRGFGQPEGVFAMERLLDKIARELQIDPLDLRRQHLIDPSELPYTTSSGARLDSGTHREAFERAVVLGDKLAEAARRRFRDDPDARIGVGMATFVEGTACNYLFTSGHWTSQETCDIRLDPDGGVTVACGVSTAGQGVPTMVATVTAEALGVERDRVRVVIGDTDMTPYGLGGWASRSTIVASGAIVIAAAEVRQKAIQIAAHLLEVSPDDLEIEAGSFFVKGSRARSATWRDVAHTALIRTHELPAGMDPGLDARATYFPLAVEHVLDERGRVNAAASYSNSSHVAVVKVDVGTGEIQVVEYAVVHDCGRVVNPQIVAGQIHGAVAQGIGGVLYEEFEYDEQAQPQSTTFMTYLVPTATEVPPIGLVELESPAPNTAYGVKGVGEAGIIGPPAAITRAVEDALSEFDPPEIVQTPIMPRLVTAIVDGQARG